MREGNKCDSPVFKKRFARRKTTQRPFTFARNFEYVETSAAERPIVSQVGDRGVIITSPVQLSKSNKGLTISDIVRQSPVPVLIAHSTPKEKQKEQSRSEEEKEKEEANSSILRRSFRSREPSEWFVSRRQHPHGTPQHAEPYRAPDEYYIGSKNTSNIDAEISIKEDDGKAKGSRRKGLSASSSRPSQQKARQKTPDLSSSAPGRSKSHDSSKSASGTSGTRQPSAKKNSNRKGTHASAKSASGRKSKGQVALDRTPSPLSSGLENKRNNSSNKAKRVAPSSLSKRSKDDSVVSASLSKRDEDKGITTSSAVKRNKDQSVASSSYLKRKKDDSNTASLSKRKKEDSVAASSVSSINNNDSVSSSSSRSQRSVVKKKTLPPSSKRKRDGGVSISNGQSKPPAAQRVSSQQQDTRETGDHRTVNKNMSLKRSDTIALRSVDKTLSQNKNKSLSLEDENQTSEENEDRDLSASRSSGKRSVSPTGKKRDLPQREKANRTFRKDGQSASLAPSVQNSWNEMAKSTSLVSRKRDGSQSESHKDYAYRFIGDPRSSSSRHFYLSDDESGITASAAKKRKASADKSAHSNKGARLSAVKASDNRHKQNSSRTGSITAIDARSLEKNSESVGRKKKVSHDENPHKALGPSHEKISTSSQPPATDADVTEHQTVRQEIPQSSLLLSTRSRPLKQSLLTTPATSLAKKKQRHMEKKNYSQSNSSQANRRLSQGSDDVPLSIHRSQGRQITQASKLKASHKSVLSCANGSPAKVVSKETGQEKISPQKSSNRFWKTRLPYKSSASPKKRQQVLSQASCVSDNVEERRASNSTAVLWKVKQKGPSRSRTDQRKSDRSEDGETGPSKPLSVVTELNVIMNMLEDAEDDFMEESTASRPCLDIVQKAFSFTQKQLKETDGQLKQISELDHQVNKMKSACKALSNESKEKLQQKFILKKELQSVKSCGIDTDILRIDQWMKDLRHLRQDLSS